MTNYVIWYGINCILRWVTSHAVVCDLLYILHAFLAALVWSQLIFNCQSVRVGLALNFHNFHLSKVGKFATVCLGPDCKTGHKALQGYSPRKSAKLQDNRANLYTFLISGAWKMRVASKPYQSPPFCSAWLRRYPFRYWGGPFRPPCWKIAISPEPNLRWTWHQSVNSSLSVVVQ